MSFAHQVNPSIPLVDAEFFNGFVKTTPAVGNVAIFKYKNNVSHIALIEFLGNNGFLVSECNFIKDKCGKRWVEWDNYALQGFFQPSQPTRPREFLAEKPSQQLPFFSLTSQSTSFLGTQ